MAYPSKFDPPSAFGLVLVPEPDAMVQDLGDFRSRLRYEADILPGSALICAAENGEPVVREDGRVLFAFEGNANGADNLHLFHEKCVSAAGRLATRYGSIAYGMAAPEALHPVAHFDMARFVFAGILDRDRLEAWSGASIDDMLPPADLATPTSTPKDILPLLNLPLRQIAGEGRGDAFAWSLMDGTVLTLEAGASRPTAWRPGDRGLDDILARTGLNLAERLRLTAPLDPLQDAETPGAGM